LRYACKQRVKVRGAKPIFFTADVLAAPPAGLPQFDVIVSNPPYICDSERAAMRPNVLDFEPAEALFVPDDDPLRFYRAIARWADALLRPDGHIYLEINERFGPEVAALFPGSTIHPDISGRDRFVIR
jgi:release factor glutamine methyltransferase